jgi:penicillin-binding protein 1C
MLDDRDLGPALARPQVMPAPGPHRLRLVDTAGRVVDQARFTIR